MAGKNQLLFAGFQRLRDFPLDPSGLFEKLDDLKKYVTSNPIAHPGQVLVVYGDSTENNGIFVIGSKKTVNDLILIPNIKVTDELSKSFSTLKGLFDTLDINTKARLESFQTTISDFTNDVSEKFEKYLDESNSKIEEFSTKYEENIDSLKDQIDEIVEKNGSGYDELKSYIDNDIIPFIEEKFFDYKELEKLFEEFHKVSKEDLDAIGKSVAEINQWVQSHKVEFANFLLTNEKFLAVEKLAGENKDAIDGINTKINYINDTVIPSLATNTKVNELSETLTSSITTLIGSIESIQSAMLTKEEFKTEIDTLKSNVSDLVKLKNVEQIAEFAFGNLASNEVSFDEDSMITGIDVLVSNPTDNKYDLLADILLENDTDDYTVLISGDDLFFVNEKDEKDWVPNIFSFKIFATAKKGQKVKISSRSSSFQGTNGTIFIKYKYLPNTD